jgi:single-strand DNA-binding protein
MASLNRVFLMGNITRDPELRYIPSGSAVTTFTIAVNRVYKLQTGEKKEEVSFVRVVVWGRMAEVCGEYLTKGSPVFVEGRLQSRSWDAPDGQKRSTMEVIATNIQFLRGGQGQGPAGAGIPSKGREEAEGGSSAPSGDLPDIQLEEPPDMGGGKADSGTPF